MDNTRTIAVIPARSGSKGLPNKNTLKIAGKTLIEIAISQALKIKGIEKVVFSSDSLEYCNLAEKAGAHSFDQRPKELSRDNTKTVEVLLDLTKHFQNLNTILLLQPTSPIRSIQDIQDGFNLSITKQTTVISVAKVEEPHPIKMFNMEDHKELKPYDQNSKFNCETPRQLLPNVFRLTGAFYSVNVKQMLTQHSVVPVGSFGHVTSMYPNIDSQEDFDYIEWMIKSNKSLPKDFMEIIKSSNFSNKY